MRRSTAVPTSIADAALPVWPDIRWPNRVGVGSTAIDAWRRTALLLVVAALATAPYGAVMGGWHGGRLALYAAVKLPLLFFLTWLMTIPFGWMVNRVAGLSVKLEELAPASVQPLLGAGVALLALVPVNVLFTWSFPGPSPDQPANHNALYLIHVLTVAVCGTVAAGPLLRLLRKAGRAGTFVFFVWLLVYALVAGEMAWALRPFIGNPYEPVGFLRPDAFDGNVYEFIWTDILPALGAAPTI